MKYTEVKKVNGIKKSDLKIKICGNCKNYLWDIEADRHNGICKLAMHNEDFTIMAAPLGRLHALTGCEDCYYFNKMSIKENNLEVRELSL